MKKEDEHIQKDLEPFVEIAKGISQLFYPFVETAFLDYPSRAEKMVLNRLSKHPFPARNSNGTPSAIETLPDGRKVKTWEKVLYNSKGKPLAIFLIRFDVSVFTHLQTHLQLLLGNETKATSWQAQIENFIHQYLREHHLTLEGASRNMKRELIYRLYQWGAFKYKDAAPFLAHLLNISRATLYNYLKWATTMAGLRIHQVDAFTEERFGGNPAGVVLDAEGLEEEIMRKITREMNLSETAFVLPSRKGDFRLRYFTPSGQEVSFCGHSTVGALYMIAHEKREGILGPGIYPFQIETKAGDLSVEIHVEAEEKVTISYATPPICPSSPSYTLSAVCEALGISEDVVDLTKPLLYETTNQDLFLTIKSLKDLESIRPDFKKAEAFAKEKSIVAYCLLTPKTFDPNNHVHIRCFAPAVGIPEDPFTGSVLGGLVAYLCEYSLIPDEIEEIGIEQGQFIHRPGKVRVRFRKDRGGYSAVVIAKAVHLFSTEIKLK